MFKTMTYQLTSTIPMNFKFEFKEKKQDKKFNNNYFNLYPKKGLVNGMDSV